MQTYQVSGNRLQIGGAAAEDLVKQYGSPLYAYDAQIIRDRYRRLYSSLAYDKKRIHYAMKANSNLKILEILRDEGAGIDAVSLEEALLALKAGFAPEKVVLTGINLTDQEVDTALEKGILLNLGSLSALEKLGRRHPGSKVSIRVNPDFGAGHHDHVITGGRKSKFGIFYSQNHRHDLNKVREILTVHQLNLVGIQAHIGSGILEEAKFVELMKIILKIASEFENLEFVDFGGGIGVPYRPNEKDFDLEKFGTHAGRLMSDYAAHTGLKPTLCLEPGRFLVAESGFLLATVTDIKDNPSYTFVGLDTGFNHLIRPMAYGSYHPIVNASRVEGETKKVVVTGYVCESGDMFTRGEHGLETREITMPREGEILALCIAGAYGFVMSSNYNTRPRPAEVLVEDRHPRLVRRRETMDDLLKTMEI